MSLNFVMTVGIERLEYKDLQLTVSIIRRLYEDGEHFISFHVKSKKTEVTDGNENPLCTVDKALFSTVKVWAIFGDDGVHQYYTLMLPEEY